MVIGTDLILVLWHYLRQFSELEIICTALPLSLPPEESLVREFIMSLQVERHSNIVGFGRGFYTPPE
jgi:hypothetical protein